MNSRRSFLKGAALFGTAALTGGCASTRRFFDCTHGAPMQRFPAPALKEIRVGIVGMGGRGMGALSRLSKLPGVKVVAVCDNVPDKVTKASAQLAALKKPAATEYLGDEAWKKLCEDERVNVVYNTTPWHLHVPVALTAMRGGKHVFTEVPSAFTEAECWELVETSEETQCHCMQLENCCYGEIEMLSFNLAKLGMLGEIVHGEGAYIHDLRHMCKRQWPEAECWRFDHNRDHAGNAYPTHGLVPLCLTMDINRGDRLDYVVSLDSKQANFKHYMDTLFPANDARRNSTVAMGDMNSSLIRTALGKSILVQHDVASPRPYSRIQLLSGTKGIVCDYPFRIVFEEKTGAGAHGWYSQQKANEIREKYRHPLWKTIGELAKRVGGHGGMDFIMDARWAYCLQNGLPLDTDVYDLAATCCLCELTEKSATNRSRAYDIPDFTRGAWRTNPPLEIVDIDLNKFTI